MDLREVFETGLKPEEYAALLSEGQRGLHALHGRRGEVSGGAVDAVRNSGVSRLLVITEPWCGDSLAILPVVLELFERAGAGVRIVRRDEHPGLIDRYLTNGARAIPIVIGLGRDYEELFHWGPRPRPAQKIADDARGKMAEGRVEKAEIHKRIRVFYAKDRGRSIVGEIADLVL